MKEKVAVPLTESGAPSRSDWAAPNGPIGAYIREESGKTLEAYRSQPNLVDEHANYEEDTARGGYAHRQLFELVQNGADSLSESSGGRIWIRLTSTHLYCADGGQAIDSEGVTALMFSHLSPKRGTSEIGRFGLGFKSVLGVTDTPEFFSHSGSFRFARARAAVRIQSVAPNAQRYPALRLPEAIEPWPEMEADPILSELMGWAVNIVRLPLKPGAHRSLVEQIDKFPPEFLLFVEHVTQLVLQPDEQAAARTFSLYSEDGLYILKDDESTANWLVFKTLHQLSADAKNDSRSLDDADEVPISWAAPMGRLNDPGRFWAFFPTHTSSLLSGILNAPWKTNEDRQNLLPGIYNDELIDATATMVANALPQLSTTKDPARHLDALPRRGEPGDSEHSRRLRNQLYSNLQGRVVVPDQDSRLRRIREVSYPPRELTGSAQTASAALERWSEYDGPTDWLHHSALIRNRLAKIDALHSHRGKLAPTSLPVPRTTVPEWLEALVKRTSRPGEASMAAIQTAALIPESIRANNELGNIVLTADGKWVEPDPDTVFLGGGHASSAGNLVNPQLEADQNTLDALRALGIMSASAESVFRDIALNLLDPKCIIKRFKAHRRELMVSDAFRLEEVMTAVKAKWAEDWGEFWRLRRDVDQSAAARLIRECHDDWRDSLQVRTIAGEWRSLFESLIPGRIVPSDGSRDSNVAIDMRVHEVDLPLLRQLGAADAPRRGHALSHSKLSKFRESCRAEFTRQDLPRDPRRGMLNFDTHTTTGPLDVLESLSEEGKALYTWHILDLPDTYRQWTMRHDTQDIYPPMDFDSPALEALRQYGRVETDDGIRDLSDGLGNPPRDPAVLRKLLSHPQYELIYGAFGIEIEDDTRFDPIGEDDPVLLIDVWPGLESHIPGQQATLELVRCDGFQQLGGGQDSDEPGCITKNGFVYVARKDDDREELQAVLKELGLHLTSEHFEKVLLGLTGESVRAERAAVRKYTTDEERLLAAVGEAELLLRLPEDLVAMLEDEHGALSGIQIAQAAISTFHTSALREYRDALRRLDPPRKWAGRPRAVEFVRSLGFGEEWAGDRSTRRDPYIEVAGPYTLPDLHDYQRIVVSNVRSVIRSDGVLGERRGMISMPTGSGKTRVAVQSIVEAIREGEFDGGILWVADRDELCEQAVEAWRQVWASEGTEETQLRISRMWAGQERPLPTGKLHVIVATIQTLSAKIGRPQYEFLADFKLLVFDEAHRSVAPTFTSVMQDIGLTRWRRAREPLLIGLTATPYRGHDERETERLVRRYGQNRLDARAFASDDPEDVIRDLQAMRVLAHADHATIEGGKFSLSAYELRASERAPWLPQSVQDRIAHDAGRTRRIIDAYEELIDPDWPTLIFATSVEHSKTVAALLSSKGIEACAVNASTDASARRRVVEEFRAGEIKALVNYGIFREGFDAPKTRAIVVARPVYSPNLYFQMIGRGLRGEKNGGSDRCLILNVRDNIENFERKLAFSELDWLWDSE